MWVLNKKDIIQRTILQSPSNHHTWKSRRMMIGKCHQDPHLILRLQQEFQTHASPLIRKSNWILHYYSILWIVLLLPIPLSRVYLHDHTVMQVLIGSFVGVIFGAVCHICIVQGCLCQSGEVNSRTMMELVVNCHFGKWIGFNF
jgi:hypothetical protein